MIAEINSKGLRALQLGNYEEAEEAFRRCIQMDNHNPQLHYNLALTWYRQGKRNQARTKFNTVVNFDRSFSDAWAMIGEIAREECNYPEASYAWLQALIYEQNLKKKVEYRTLRGFNELIQGKIKEGYDVLSTARDYERTDPPQWSSSIPLQGKTLLVQCDQGFGDQIFYARWLPWLCSLGANLVVNVAEPLQRLFTPLLEGGVISVIGAVQPGAEILTKCDYQIKLSDLPLIFNTTVGTVPVQPYIKGFTFLSEQPYVGLAWSGNPLHRNDKERSIPLREFEPLFGLDVGFYMLQKDVRESDRATLEWSSIEVDEEFYDFHDVAGVMSELDLVISCDTAVANLAGAMGKETWVLVPYSPDWRWMATGDSTIWYPSVKVYRQDEDRQWGTVIEKVKQDLLERLK